METALWLLMRVGAATVTFRPTLTPEQYAELTPCVNQAETKEELRREMEAAAKRWQCEIEFDK